MQYKNIYFMCGLILLISLNRKQQLETHILDITPVLIIILRFRRNGQNNVD